MDAETIIEEALREVPPKKPKQRPKRRWKYAEPGLRKPLPFRTVRWKCWESRSRYTPHQGERECARRRRQMGGT